MAVALATVAALACGESTGPARVGPPAKVEAATGNGVSAVVGATVPVVAKVSDADGRGVPGVRVSFAVATSAGSVAPGSAVTGDDGMARASWTLGTIVGENRLSASVSNVTTGASFRATGTVGPLQRVVANPKAARLARTNDTVRLQGLAEDEFGNRRSEAVRWESRNPSLVTVDASGLVRALRDTGTTRVVVTSGSFADSATIHLTNGNVSICASVGVTAIAVGDVFQSLRAEGTCLPAGEYALSVFANVVSAGVETSLEVTGRGLAAASGIAAASAEPATTPVLGGTALSGPEPDQRFHDGLRDREREEVTSRVEGARQWFREARTPSRGPDGIAMASAIPSTLNVGDLLPLNANPLRGCDSADVRMGRVMAITERAIVVADTSNPLGGFTTQEFRDFGVNFDTLVYPQHVQTFGEPTDIDRNGKIVIFFTRAVNQMSPRGSSAYVAGFFYVRDLIPIKPPATFPYSGCAASNEGEMFYVFVPDPDGVVTNRFTKAFVQRNALSVIAHEMEHLVNYSRRLYVNQAPFEEKWLDEGLAHIAQELVFFRASGLTARSNLSPAGMRGVAGGIDAFNQHMIFNWTWLTRFMEKSDRQSVYSSNDQEERGAAWSFLRYLADRRGALDGDLWFRLVNSKNAGFNNLRDMFGPTVMSQMRDWTVALFMDDLVADNTGRFSMPTWNTRAVVDGFGLTPFPLKSVTLRNEVAAQNTVRGGSSILYRLTVPAGGEALLTATSPGGSVISPSLQFSLVRIR